ncbi:MAG: hypothetical protein J6M56_05845 [Clostridia bacterium]|nr:hypothetical protein [Clostridia bacterium]
MMKKRINVHERQEELCLHDELVKDIRITEINYAEWNVEIRQAADHLVIRCLSFAFMDAPASAPSAWR